MFRTKQSLGAGALLALIVAISVASPGNTRSGATSYANYEPRPARDIEQLLAGETWINTEEAISIAHHLGGRSAHIVRHSETVRIQGAGVGLGQRDGDTLFNDSRDGLWWYPAGGVIMSRVGPELLPVIIAPGDIVIVGAPMLDNDLLTAGMPAVSVTCGVNHYSCCYADQNGRYKAVCVPNGQNPPGACSSGGPGASSCSLGGGPIGLVDTIP